MTNRTALTKIPAHLLLLVLGAVYFSGHFFLSTRQLPNYPVDDVSQMHMIPNYLALLAHGAWHEIYFSNLHNYSPVYQVFNAGLVKFFGRDWRLMLYLSNLCFFLITILYTFLLGELLAGKRCGIYAAICLMLAPLITQFIPVHSLDFAGMALTVPTIYYLLRSEWFSRPFYSLLSWLLLGLTLMTRYSTIANLAGPLLLVVAGALATVIRDRKYLILANITLGLVVFFLIIQPYLGSQAVNHIAGHPFTEPTATSWYSFANWRMLIPGLWENYLGLPLFLLFIFGLQPLWRLNFPFTALLTVWVVPLWLILLLMPHWKTPRYFLPAVPVLALICALGIGSLSARRCGKILVWLVLGLAAIRFIVVEHGPGLQTPLIGKLLYYETTRRHEIRQQHDLAANYRRIIDRFKGLLAARGDKKLVIFVAPGNTPNKDLNTTEIGRLFWFNKLNVEFSSVFAPNAIPADGIMVDWPCAAVMKPALHSRQYLELVERNISPLLAPLNPDPRYWADHWPRFINNYRPEPELIAEHLKGGDCLYLFLKLP